MALSKASSSQAIDQHKRGVLDQVLALLSENDLTFRDLMNYVFEPANKQGTIRWDGFFKFKGSASHILDTWVSKKNSRTARAEVEEWCVKHVGGKIRKEAKRVTNSGYLRTSHLAIDGSFISRFNLTSLGLYLSKAASITSRLLTTFASSSKHILAPTPTRSARKATIVTSTMLQLLGEHSTHNNLSRKLLGLYLYATGTERQPISVLSHLGISESYTSIVAKERRKKSTGATPNGDSSDTTEQYTRAGTLRSLSASMREAARRIAATGTFAVVYDNINIMFRAAEQALGRTDSLENGTCATIWPLWQADIRDMQLSDFNAAYNAAGPLLITDILHSPDEASLFRQCLIHSILRIIISHGGEPFQRFKADLEEHQPKTGERIEPHSTEMFPLPAMEIDESTISGNVDVINTIAAELKLEETTHFNTAVKIFAGDQLSISRLRSAANIRAGHEGGFASFGWGVWMPGLFHTKMADTQGTLLNHWGKPNTGILSEKSTLEDCGRTLKSWDELYTHAEAIYDRYADARLVHQLCQRRSHSPESDRDGDMVLENGILFMRDALISFEFTHSIKWGDMGRVRQVLKTWKIIVNNCLVNPTGHKDGFVEVDLAQEHYNYWHKDFYIAHGNIASWDWLAMISPCVSLLRKLVSSIKSSLGSWQGIRHKSPDLSVDIRTLMSSLSTHNVYNFQKGRILDDDDGPVKDVITAGLQQLTNGTSSPLKEYNNTFTRLQQRRQMTSVAAQSQAISVAEEVNYGSDTDSEFSETASDDGQVSEAESDEDNGGLDVGDIALEYYGDEPEPMVGEDSEPSEAESESDSDHYSSVSDSGESTCSEDEEALSPYETYFAQSHPHHPVMDAFTAITNFFTATSNVEDTTVAQPPINEEGSGSGGGAYCVIA
ncbi:hypothetical protein ONZ45_g3620 [Pleurotus djamor]|nr:hypothetical protein ONZ45_g3620 [Pleurotus djamor]